MLGKKAPLVSQHFHFALFLYSSFFSFSHLLSLSLFICSSLTFSLSHPPLSFSTSFSMMLFFLPRFLFFYTVSFLLFSLFLSFCPALLSPFLSSCLTVSPSFDLSHSLPFSLLSFFFLSFSHSPFLYFPSLVSLTFFLLFLLPLSLFYFLPFLLLFSFSPCCLSVSPSSLYLHFFLFSLTLSLFALFCLSHTTHYLSFSFFSLCLTLSLYLISAFILYYFLFLFHFFSLSVSPFLSHSPLFSFMSLYSHSSFSLFSLSLTLLSLLLSPCLSLSSFLFLD